MHSRLTPEAAGLSDVEVQQRIAAGLVNRAPSSSGRSVRQILRANVFTRFNAILGTLFVVVMFVGPLQDGLFGIVLAANTLIGIFQELRAKRTLDRLAVLTAPVARVVREAGVREVPADQVVMDDLVELRPGDQVVVDGVVASSDGLEIDEALLSGEAEPVAKAAGDDALSGSFVVAGTGRVRTTGIGESAYAARLQAQARRFSLVHSELQAGTNRILRLVTWVMVPVSVALVASLLLRSHETLANALRESVAGVGAMVPEGLVLLTSIAFALGALRLARRRVLVQELAALEGLARVDVLCIDKTGTLTEPGMQLEEIVALGDADADELECALGELAGADPAPNATMRALAGAGVRERPWAVTARQPFSSVRKWSAVTFAGHGTWVLGAPSVMAPSGSFDGAVERRERAGQRVLLLARSEARAGPALPDRLSPEALVVLAERVREDAAGTLAYLKQQGISIKVLSGDAPATVAAVAGRAGVEIVGAPVDAGELAAAGQSIGAALAASNVFGRVRPEQKLEAVRALQDDGHVVAMLGDGVNDVPALKLADLGIAMGSGSQSSRSVARVVLLDSAFSTVPEVLGEGRRVIANIERVANLFVTKTVYAALLATVVAIAGVPFPFFPRHLTIVSTLTIGVPGFLLALAPGAPRAQPGFTRRVLSFTLPAGTAAGAAAMTAYALARATPSCSAGAARTASMLALLALGVWVLGLIARPLTPVRCAAGLALALALAALFAWPLTRRVFSLALPPLAVWVELAAVVAAAVVGLSLWRRAYASPALSWPRHAGHSRGHGVLERAADDGAAPGARRGRDGRGAR
jgi:cation-transporting P-type ATPase E